MLLVWKTVTRNLGHGTFREHFVAVISWTRYALKVLFENNVCSRAGILLDNRLKKYTLRI